MEPTLRMLLVSWVPERLFLKKGLLPIEWVKLAETRLKPRLSRDDSKPLFRTGLNQCVQRQSGEDRLVPLRAAR